MGGSRRRAWSEGTSPGRSVVGIFRTRARLPRADAGVVSPTCASVSRALVQRNGSYGTMYIPENVSSRHDLRIASRGSGGRFACACRPAGCSRTRRKLHQHACSGQWRIGRSPASPHCARCCRAGRPQDRVRSFYIEVSRLRPIGPHDDPLRNQFRFGVGFAIRKRSGMPGGTAPRTRD